MNEQTNTKTEQSAPTCAGAGAEDKTMAKRYYYAGKPTGSYHSSDGSPEIGNTCGHQHRTEAAAERCAAHCEAPGFSE